MMSENVELDLIDLEPKTGNILKEVLTGLSKGQKTIHPKFLYDKKGSEIFEEICLLDEYYPTRAEKSILKKYGKQFAKLIGPDALIVEPGAGAGEKIRLLLPHLKNPAGYVPIEISKEILLRMTSELIEENPGLNVLPVCADFSQDIELPLTVESQQGKKVLFFPGSTIGNMNPEEAVQFLKKYGRITGHGSGLLIGVDCKKDPEHFQKAYDDSLGVTARFNLNLLERLNREAGATFDIENFKHEAIWNEDEGRVEMHLRSKVSQLVRVNQTIFRFLEGETIHTESSYKYSPDQFIEICAKARFTIRKHWTDENKMFCVYYFERD